ncbi:GNAT family N-acetyltransferase [Pseudoalteromonas sp. SMS1]|uniref:GNAT family N-acetyltransferase n=1 Tax=Pseudoalteromonas sp. SMS1 TaxID=2908894 RepID=UPI001F322B70|nr:GNAT family N-acetyltransferase [Pseudoalteromonas sp. SMS1]MCF2856066.1 GNAT family N-acetyltransferase [Pseudoalteromonas sp. SMS1]
MDHSTLLTTQRCSIRKATLNDATFIVQLLRQKSFIDNIGDKNVCDEQSAQEYIKKAFLTPYQSGALAPYIVSLKNEEPIGIVGFYQRPYLNAPDLGYALLDQYTGQGLALEVCTTLMQFAKSQLNLSALYAVTDPNNERSQKLLAKLGFNNSGYLYAHSPHDPVSLFIKLFKV